MNENNKNSSINIKSKELTVQYNFKINDDLKNIDLSIEDIEKAIQLKINSMTYLNINKEIMKRHIMHIKVFKKNKEYRIYILFRTKPGFIVDKNKHFIKVEDFEQYGIYLKVDSICEIKKNNKL